MKVALVHDYLIGYGGAERVLEALHEIFPQAPVYTSYLNLKGLGSHAKEIKKWNIRASWLQKMPGAKRLLSPLRIFAPLMFESFDMSEYDVVISSSAAYFAKAVITKPGALHIAYIHTPPRYLYGYTTAYDYKKNPVIKVLAELVNHLLRIYDYHISQRPDILVANSENVAQRIKKFYRREAVVIYPPVSLPSFPRRRESKNGSPIRSGMTGENREYYLSLGRLVRGKGIEIIVQACTDLGLPLKVAGSGPELQRLKNIAGKSVEFLGHPKDEDLPEVLAGAKATIVASEDEDFGIVPVESMAAGTPVIAVKAGGFLETVISGKTGEFFPSTRSARSGQVHATVESLKTVLAKFNPKMYKIEDCQKQAERFSKERFKKEILKLIEDNLKDQHYDGSS